MWPLGCWPSDRPPPRASPLASWGASHNMGQLDTSQQQPAAYVAHMPAKRSLNSFCLLSALLLRLLSLSLTLSPSRLMALLNLQDMCIIFKRTMRLSRSLNAPPATAATCHICHMCHTPPATCHVTSVKRQSILVAKYLKSSVRSVIGRTTGIIFW